MCVEYECLGASHCCCDRGHIVDCILCVGKAEYINLFHLRNSSDMAPTSSTELAELMVPGVGGIDPPLSIWPEDELNTESAELPVHGIDGTRKYLL